MSAPLKLDWTDAGKILKGGLVAGGGAGLAYLAENAGRLDFGEWTPVAVAAFSILVNVARKCLFGRAEPINTIEE